MYYNQDTNELEKLVKNIIESSRFADGNPEDPCLVRDVTKFRRKFNSGKETALELFRRVIALKLSDDDMVWLCQSLPVFRSHKYMSKKQCNFLLRVFNIMLKKKSG